MSALGDESGITDDHAPLPATLRLGPVAVRAPVRALGWDSAQCSDPHRDPTDPAKLTPGCPSVKRGRISKSPFSAP